MQAKCTDRTICFHLIYQETQFCGCSPSERVNHIYLVVIFYWWCVIFHMIYCYYIIVLDHIYNLWSKLRKGREYLDGWVLLSWIHFAFPLDVDTCVLQPPIVTSGETASTPQVLPKGKVVRDFWCVVRVEPWVFPCANKSPKEWSRIP